MNESIPSTIQWHTVCLRKVKSTLRLKLGKTTAAKWICIMNMLRQQCTRKLKKHSASGLGIINCFRSFANTKHVFII